MLKEKNPLLKLKLKNETPFITHIFNKIFESLYALYDYMLDNPIESFWYECLSIILSYLQLISFSFDKIFWNIWNQNKLIQEIYNIFDYFDVIILLKERSLLYFFFIGILIIILLSLMLALIIMSCRIRKKILNILWPIPMLKFCLPFLSNTVFGQCFVILSTVYQCNGEFSYISSSLKCQSGIWFTILAPITGFMLIFICIIALINNSLYFKPLFINSNSDILKKTDSLPDNIFLMTKVSLNLIFLLDKDNENNQWIILFFSILFTSTNAYYTLYYQNRVNNILKILNNSLSLILVSSFVSLFIGKMFVQLEFTGAIYLFFSFNVIIILYIIFFKNKEIKYISIDYKEIIEPFDYLNYIFKFYNIIGNKKSSRNNYTILESLLYGIEENCVISECPLKKYIEKLEEGIECPFLLNQFCEKLFEFGISKFNDDISLKVNYAIFLISHMNYKKKALMILNRIDQNISFQNNFILYRTLKLSEKWNFSFVNTNDSNFKYKQYTQEFKTLIKKLALLYYDFLSLLSNNSQNSDSFNKIHKIGREIIKNNPKIDETYGKLINIQTDNMEIIKLYSEFVEGILYDEEKLEKCENNSKITFSSFIDFHEKDFTNFDIEILNEKGRKPYLIISSEKEQFGKIIDISLNSLKIFGYSKLELVGQHINILIPKLFHKVHDIILNQQNEINRLKFFDELNKKKEYFPDFIKKEIFGISKMKFLIELDVIVYFVKTEENKLVYIIIIENYNPLMMDLINDNNNNSKYCVLTDENFLIQTFTPNCMDLLNLNYSDINSNFNIINYIKQFQEDYLTAINNIGLTKYSHINKSEFFSEDKSELKSNNKFHIPSFVKKKIKSELFSRKYSKKCKITWRINYDTNISFSRIHKRNISNKSIEFNTSDYNKSNLFVQSRKDLSTFYDGEKNLYMQIEKIIINQEFLGYYFYFSKRNNKNNHYNLSYIHEKNEIKDKNNNIIKVKKYQCIFKNQESNIFDLNKIDFKNDSMFSSAIVKPSNKKYKEKKEKIKYKRKGSHEKIQQVSFKEVKQTNPINNCSFINFKKDGLNLNELLKDDNNNDNDIIITGDFIPECLTHFVIDLNNASFYQVDLEENKINYLEILKKEANDKINAYQKQLKLISKNTDSSYNESNEESDESSSDSNTNVDSLKNSFSNSLYDNITNNPKNNSTRKDKDNQIKKTPSKFFSKMLTKDVPTPKNNEKNISVNSNANSKKSKKNSMVDNYYKVNLSHVHLYIFDFNKDLIVEINKFDLFKEEEKKKAQNSKIELLLTPPKVKEPIDFDKDERFSFINILNLKYKKNIKEKDNKENVTISNPVSIAKNNIKDNINEEKLIRKKIYESLNQNKDEPPIKNLKYLMIFSFIVLIISGIISIILDLQYISIIIKSLDGIKYVSFIKYCCQIGVYYLREISLLNFKVDGLRGGSYTEFVAKNEDEYNQLIREEIMKLFIESQTSIKSVYSISLPSNDKSAKLINKFKTNIRISNSPEIDMKYSLQMSLMHYSSTFFNLASSSTTLKQNHPDLIYFIYNSLNGYKQVFNTITFAYEIDLKITLKNIFINALICCLIALVFYIIIYVLVMENFMNGIRTRGNYMKVFYGINENIIKNLINNCENFMNKLKYAEEQRYFEEETVNESVEDKINIEESQKNKKIPISYNSNLNSNIEKKNNNKASYTANFFIVIYGLFNLISYSYFIYNWSYLINISKKSIYIDNFLGRMLNHHLSIIEYYNVYREYLFDNNSICSGMPSLHLLNKFEKEDFLSLREDAKYITSNIFILLPKTDSLASKTLCSFYINDYFDSSYECEEKVGLISTYNFDELTFNFLEEIRIAKNVAKYKLQNEEILGDLTNYNFTEYNEYISKIGKQTSNNNNEYGYGWDDYGNDDEESESDNYNATFRLDLFNNKTLHKNLNVIFFSIILPYIQVNGKFIFEKLKVDKEELFLITFNFLFYIIVSLVYFFYFVPVINYINTNIYKTKNMLSIIPLNVLSSQNGVLKLLNIER